MIIRCCKCHSPIIIQENDPVKQQWEGLLSGLDNWRETNTREDKYLAYEQIRCLYSRQIKFLKTTLEPTSDNTTLSLQSLNLISLPNILENFTFLTKLSINNNEFKELPDVISKITSLVELNLNSNQLKRLPDSIGNLYNLTRLDCSQNELIELPASMGNLIALERFSVSDNETLTTLPLNFTRLQQLTYISYWNTAIPDDTIRDLKIIWQAQRSATVTNALPNRFAMWQRLAKSRDNLTSQWTQCHFTDEEKISLHEWLFRLEKCKDFRSAQQKLAATVCSILSTLFSDPSFKEPFFTEVNVNLQRCGDRAAMGFNIVYTTWKLHQLTAQCSQKTKHLRERVCLFIGLAKTSLLRKKIAKLTGGGNLQESVEIYLYCEIKLKERLQLLSAIQNMLHEEIGQPSWLDLEALAQEVEQNYYEELLEFPVFEELLTKYYPCRSLHKRLEKLEKRSESKEMNEGQYKKEMDRIMAEWRAEKIKAIRSWIGILGLETVI